MNKTAKIVSIMVLAAVVVIGLTYVVQRAPSQPVVLPAPTPPPTQPAPAPNPTDPIEVTAPLPNAVVSSPLTITGRARGTWYFEASFPVRLVDANGTELGHAVAQAQGDWMTTNFVPFTATLTFTAPMTATGSLILKKDNPSGLPENDAEITVPVQFESTVAHVSGACSIGGCSGEVCSDAKDGPAVSNCMYKAEFACYKSATCETQKNGKCGWTQSSALTQCIKNAEGLKAVL